jgi:hypothetical protein
MLIEAKLDSVLDFLVLNKGIINRNKTTGYNEFIATLELDNEERIELFTILQEDKYIEFTIIYVLVSAGSIREVNTATLMLKGKLFIQNGGYTQQLKDKIISRHLQSLALWVTAVGTGLAGLYGFYLLMKALLSYFCACRS